MRGTYCYLPILPARGGAFRAVSWLSPTARSRLIPMFDIPDPVLGQGETLESHLAKRAKGIHDAWGSSRSVYVDAHNFPPGLLMSSGMHPITYVFELLRAHGSSAIPVTGTEEDREADYFAAIRSIAERERRGACLRLASDDLADRRMLGGAIANVLEKLWIDPQEMDIVLDFRFVGAGNIDSLRATAIESLYAIGRVGNFRNVVIAGGSVPDVLGKRDHDKVRHEHRVELELFTSIVTTVGGEIPVAQADYGIVSPHYAPPKRAVNVPSRIRYSTPSTHAFYRAHRSEYRELCRQLIASDNFIDRDFSLGDRRIYLCANGIIGPGNPSIWVSTDTNHHLELASDQVWKILTDAGLTARFALPEPDRRPWLQPELI